MMIFHDAQARLQEPCLRICADALGVVAPERRGQMHHLIEGRQWRRADGARELAIELLPHDVH